MARLRTVVIGGSPTQPRCTIINTRSSRSWHWSSKSLFYVTNINIISRQRKLTNCRQVQRKLTNQNKSTQIYSLKKQQNNNNKKPTFSSTYLYLLPIGVYVVSKTTSYHSRIISKYILSQFSTFLFSSSPRMVDGRFCMDPY